MHAVQNGVGTVLAHQRASLDDDSGRTVLTNGTGEVQAPDRILHLDVARLCLTMHGL